MDALTSQGVLTPSFSARWSEEGKAVAVGNRGAGSSNAKAVFADVGFVTRADDSVKTLKKANCCLTWELDPTRVFAEEKLAAASSRSSRLGVVKQLVRGTPGFEVWLPLCPRTKEVKRPRSASGAGADVGSVCAWAAFTNAIS